MNEKLANVLIVGATRGIGFELCRQFLDLKPDQLIATYRSLDTIKELKELAGKNSNLKLVKLDLIDFESYEAFANEIDQLIGDFGLTLFIHNAGILINDYFGSITRSNLTKAFTTNAVSPILLTQHLIPALLKSSSRVNNTKAVYISSILGSIKRNEGERYSHRMSKAALNQGFLIFKLRLI